MRFINSSIGEVITIDEHAATVAALEADIDLACDLLCKHCSSGVLPVKRILRNQYPFWIHVEEDTDTRGFNCGAFSLRERRFQRTTGEGK